MTDRITRFASTSGSSTNTEVSFHGGQGFCAGAHVSHARAGRLSPDHVQIGTENESTADRLRHLSEQQRVESAVDRGGELSESRVEGKATGCAGRHASAQRSSLRICPQRSGLPRDEGQSGVAVLARQSARCARADGWREVSQSEVETRESGDADDSSRRGGRSDRRAGED